jgi:hypothetical protein
MMSEDANRALMHTGNVYKTFNNLLNKLLRTMEFVSGNLKLKHQNGCDEKNAHMARKLKYDNW